jgi:predicted Zn-ribbon and HTH transcriptional regulator
VTRPPFEVADIVRIAGNKFRQRYWRTLTWPQIKVLNAIVRCRTAALGGHRDRCDRCGYEHVRYHSCRNRHCPKCQTNAREKWLRRRKQELLPVVYFHLVFSVPHVLVPLVWQNKKPLFALLFDASAATLLEVAADPRRRLCAEIGFFGILHTWGQTLQQHPHIHYVVPGGGLSPDHTRWISSRTNFFLPVKVLSRVFRDKFLAALEEAFDRNRLVFHGDCVPLADKKTFASLLDDLSEQNWVVYAKPPFGGPEHVLQYLSRYTHRVAISNHRLLSVNESEVRFRWRDYKNHNKKRTMTLTGEEFLRRFLQHVLPKGFPRIRYFGWLANRKRGRLLPHCRALLNQPPETPSTVSDLAPAVEECPKCHGPMRVIERFTTEEIQNAERRPVSIIDSS